jgi:putative endopeptidase
MNTRFRASLLAAAVLGITAATLGLVRAGETYGPWGIDLAARNASVKPGDDFFEFANGAWLARNEIPADQSSVSTGREIFNRTQDQLRTLIEASAANPSTPRAAKIGGYYRSFMDEAAIEALDAAPLAPRLAAVAAVRDKAEFATLMAKTHSAFGSSIFALAVYADAKSPVSVLYVGQGGLGLPDRDYYLADKFKAKKAAYGAYIARTLKMIGYASPEAAAGAVLDFETRIAEASWAADERRNIDKIYNPMTVAALQTYAPAIDWRSYLDTAGATGAQNIVALENTAIQRIAQLYAATPLETLKAWQTFQIASSASPLLSKRFVDNNFDFAGREMQGTPQNLPRWKRGVDLVQGSLGELIGEEYAAKYFPESSKRIMEGLVANLKTAMAERIKKLAWMSDATKSQALLKLNKMKVMVGFPVKWRDYSKLEIKPNDLVGNVERSAAFEFAYAINKIGKPVDAEEWGMTPQTVNAYNGGLENKIVFPAGILQAPLFNPSADPAVNYGAIGAIIGHEITHGFDDQGRKIDADGRLRDWWTPEDAKRFEAEAEKLAKQYDLYEPVPGSRINGKLTLGENIADLGGLVVALDAYRASLGGKPAPVLDGLTGEQRVFLAYAQGWRGKARDDAVRAQIASDPHSPRKFRVIGPTRNIDDWYAAFGVGPAERYALKPEDRVRIW